MAKFNKNSVPDDFTMSLVCVDALPVITFGMNVMMISVLFDSVLFKIGSLLCIVAGAAKVLWKLIVVTKKKNVWYLFIQMRILMPIGFLLMLVSVFVDHASLSSIWNGLISFPSCIFFLIGIIGMCLMGYFAKTLDSENLKANWIEQITNSIAQLSFFIGLFLLK